MSQAYLLGHNLWFNLPLPLLILLQKEAAILLPNHSWREGLLFGLSHIMSSLAGNSSSVAPFPPKLFPLWPPYIYKHLI